MSFQLILPFVYILTVLFPLLAGINLFQPNQEMELELMSAQTGNRTMKMYKNYKINLSVDR